MIQHIFKLIWNNKKSNAWILTELVLVSVCLWYVVVFLYAKTVNFNRPLGFDYRHVYKINLQALAPESSKYDTDSAHIKSALSDFYTIYDRIGRHPDVLNECMTWNHFHYIWSISLDYFSRGKKTILCAQRGITPFYFSVFKVKGGRGESPDKLTSSIKNNSDNIVISSDLADSLFNKNESPIGKTVSMGIKQAGGIQQFTISEISEKQKDNEYTGYSAAVYIPVSFYLKQFTPAPQDISYLGLYIRVKEDADGPDFAKNFQKQMSKQLTVGNLFLEDITPVSDYRELQLQPYRNNLYTNTAISVFLLINIFLGILGTFYLRTEQRKQELGLRIALGGTRSSLNKLLIKEGLLLLSIAALPALIVCINLAHAGIVNTDPLRCDTGMFVLTTLITYFILSVTIIIGIWLPARQAANIEPAEALREE